MISAGGKGKARENEGGMKGGEKSAVKETSACLQGQWVGIIIQQQKNRRSIGQRRLPDVSHILQRKKLMRKLPMTRDYSRALPQQDLSTHLRVEAGVQQMDPQPRAPRLPKIRLLLLSHEGLVNVAMFNPGRCGALPPTPDLSHNSIPHARQRETFCRHV